MNSDKNFHERIAEVCLKHFKTLPKTGKPSHSEWTILSCIVLETNGSFEVVALGTGTKCIGKDKLSKKGDILNDSHAEVMCRRAFIRYIYHQMKNGNYLFDFEEKSKKFNLKAEIKFHFFTTHVPCGDAAIFPMQDPEDFGDVILQKKYESLPDPMKEPGDHSGLEKNIEGSSEVPSKKIKIMENDGKTSGTKIAADIYRTGAKCLEHDEKQDPKLPGSAYHTVGCVRTKPGRGIPTLSVSCSDKLSKWCHMGLQGALPSILLDKPIYLSSLTIAGKTPYCSEALKRALFGRLGEVTLGHPFAQCALIIGQSDIGFEFSKSSVKRPCSSCIVWCKVPLQSLEVAVEGKRQGIVKKKQNTSIARLKICKLELFKLFKEICEVRNITHQKGGVVPTSYGSYKQFSTSYQSAWTSLRKCFKTWTVKNKNLLEFYNE